MRTVLAILLLLLLVAPAGAFPGRPASDLRFEGYVTAYLGEVASDGTDFLILSSLFSLPHRVYTQKVVNGRAVGPHRQIGDGKPVNLLWTGTDYLAGWSNDDGLWVAPVSRDGSPRTTPAAPVLPGDHVALAAKGSSVLAFARQGTQLTVLPLDAAGRPAGSPVTHAVHAGPGRLVAGPAADGFALVATGGNGTWLMLFRADGTAITSSPLVLDGNASGEANIATDGTDTLVVFNTASTVTETVTELKSVVAGATGTVKSTHVLHAVAGGGTHLVVATGLVWDGTQYIAAMTAERNPPFGFEHDPALLRIDRHGERIGDPAWLTTNAGIQEALALGWNGRELLVPLKFNQGFPAPTTFAVTVHPSTLHASAPSPLARTLATQTRVAVAAGTNGYLAAWFERNALRASRIDAGGNYLDGEGIVVAAPASGAPVHPGIVIDGSGPQWLVVWSSDGTTRARFLSRGGVAGAGPIAIGPGLNAGVRWDGSRYIVLRSFEGSLFTNTLSAAGGVGPSQTVLAAEALTGGEYVDYEKPSVVLLGGRPVGVFRKVTGNCIGGRCQETSTAVLGLRLDVPNVAPFLIAEHVGDDLAAAGGGAHMLVTWWGGTGVILGSDAPEQGGTPFDLHEFGVRPAVDFDGTDFVAAWWKYDIPSKSTRLVTARIATSGATSGRTAVPLEGVSEFGDLAIAAGATLPPLLAFRQQLAVSDDVQRATLLFASELDDAPAPPAAPSIGCANTNADGTITVRWQPVANALGVSIELELPDGTFRRIGVAAGGATSARVSRAGLEGDSVRLRAWNAGGFSAPSPVARSSSAPAATLRTSLRTCAGTPATIGITLEGTPPFTVRWSDGLVQSNVNAYSVTRTVTVTRDTTFTIVSVADRSCAVNEVPESIRVTVDPQPAIENQTHQVKVTSGQTATLSVVASDATQFAWFEGARGDVSHPVGGNSAAFTTPPLAQSTRYWVRVSNRCGHIDSAVMNVTVGGKRRSARR